MDAPASLASGQAKQAGVGHVPTALQDLQIARFKRKLICIAKARKFGGRLFS